MQVDEARRPFEDLVVDFCDEDAPTWTAAAREIGRRAATDAEALQFLIRRMGEAPGAGAGEEQGYRTTGLRPAEGERPRENLHRFRHAVCAVASYASEAGADDAPFAEMLDGAARPALVGPCFELLAKEGAVGDLKQLPGVAEQFDRWRGGQIQAKRKLVERFSDGGNPQALEANRRQLAELEALTDASPVPAGFRPAAAKLRDASKWALPSYLAGVRTERGLLGVPLGLLARALAAAAAARRSAGLLQVMSLPEMLGRLAGQVDPGQWDEALGALTGNVSPDWREAGDQFNKYVVALASLAGAPPLRELWHRGVHMPDWLEADLNRLAELATEGADDEAARVAAGVMRRIADRYFGDDWHWKELTEGERFSLNVYTLLMAYGPAVLLLGGHGGQADLRRGRPSRDHRLALLLDGIAAAGRARSTLLPALVRCLKFLLRSEMNEYLDRQGRRGPGGGREALAELMALCRRQMLIVKQLLSDWLLPVTLRKDLATIVCRALHVAVAEQQRHRDELARTPKAHAEYAVELVYFMLYAFPDNLLLKEMIAYSTDDRLCRLFDCIRGLIEQFEAYDRALGEAATTIERISRAEAAADRWKRSYGDFAALLAEVSLHDLAAPNDRWIDALVGMIGHVSRMDAAQPADESRPDPERPLRPILLTGQKSRQHWQTLVDESAGGRADPAGARDERSERESRLALAARAAAGRFENLLDDIGVLENACLPEVGNPRMDEDIVHHWRRMINRLEELSVLASEELPRLERELCTRLIDQRIGHVLEPRLQRIVEIVDQEREGQAKEVLTHQVHRLRSEAASGGGGVGGSTLDMELVQDWMLRRYMIRDLADSYGLRVLGWLTNPRFVAGWIIFPFVACAILNLCGADSWQGIPFGVTCLGNFALLAAFAVESHSRLPGGGRVRISAWRFLLPQTTAAIFLGIFQAIPSDEGWSTTIHANLWVQVLTWGVYLVAGFIFTREIILGGQFRGKGQKGTKSRRATELMALGLWQSFLLVMFFAIAAGRIMAGPDRGVIDAAKITGLGKLAAELIPIEVYLGPGFLQPAASRDLAAFWIFPRALVSWTIQMFFFGAIFERIMGRGKE